MKKSTLIAATLATLGLTAHGGFAQGLGATSVVADGVKSGPVLQRVPDTTSAPVPGQNPMVPPAGGSSGGGAQAPIPPAPAAAPGSAAGGPAAGPNAGAPGQAAPQIPAFTPAQYKQAVKDTELFNAAYAGETWNVKNAIAKGAKINSSDWRYGFTPLMWASLKGHLGTVRYLLDRGARVDASSKLNASFVIASGKKAYDLGQAVMGDQIGQFSARTYLYTNRGGVTALMLAAAGGYNLTVRELLASKAKPDLTEPDGSTALMLAAFSGNIPATQALLQAGAKVNATDKQGATALTHATYDGDTRMIRYLLARGARVKVSPATSQLPAFARSRGFKDAAVALERAAKKEKDPVAAGDGQIARPDGAPLASGEGVIILN